MLQTAITAAASASASFPPKLTANLLPPPPAGAPPPSLIPQFPRKSERGLSFSVSDCFYRDQSAVGRDLGVLAAALYKRSHGSLSVLDAMCGCGVRSLRYLSHSDADFVWANDANDGTRQTIVANLSQETRVSEEDGTTRRWVVTHRDADKLMAETYLHEEFFDLIDVDSFGSDTLYLRSALSALKFGGLLYLTSTDGYSSGGHRPHCSLASYGAFIRPMPYSNEVGLRMLIGGALREAASLGFKVSPLFSYYSYHGPVFRVMLRVKRGKMSESRNYGFISYCKLCGNSVAHSWDSLGKISCSCVNNEDSRSLTVSGPLWVGPLHNADDIVDMLELAGEWGWTASDSQGKNLDKLLRRMLEESDPRLPFGYLKIDEVASRGKMNSPPIAKLMDALRQEGYAVSRSHISPNAIKTNCLMTTCIKIARDLTAKVTK